MRYTRGFTLLELMIVVSMIGIMAAIAIPAYQGYVIRTQVVEGIHLAGELKPAIRDIHKSDGVFPADNDAAGVPPAQKLLGNYVEGIVVEEGAIHITYGHYINANLHGQILTLRPIIVKDSPASPMSWSCGYREPPPGMQAAGPNRTSIDKQFLPGACRARPL